MARIVKTADERRSQLIACAQKFFYSKGYQATSIRDIINEVGIAKGTFYHYFSSKEAILEALVKELTTQGVQILQNIVADESLAAIPKWVQAFQVLSSWKTDHKAEVLAVLQVMRKNENIRLVHEIRTQALQTIAPEVAKIIAQGVDEGVFETKYIENTAEIVLAIMATFSDAIGDIILNPDNYDNPIELAQRKYAAIQMAIERVLGAPPGSLPILDSETLMAWFEDI